jgi:ribosomal protein S19
MTILPSMLNRVFFVHNGRSFSKLRISDPRFFFLKMGSFSFTRKIYYEKRVKNSKKNFK